MLGIYDTFLCCNSYVRLELLEGLAAFYGSGDAAAARERLLSAQVL